MLLYQELKRRNVFRVAVAYLALAWLLTEVAGTLFPAFGIPDWAFRFVVIILALGFIPALIFSWAYEITPEGVKREKDVLRESSITHFTAKRLDGITIGLIVAALAFILADRFWLSPRQTEQITEPATVMIDRTKTPEPETTESQYPPNSIAVLAFADMSPEGDQEYFSDGIAEEMLNLLSKIPDLRVISRSSAFSFKDKDFDIPTIAAQLNVAYVLEGSVRKAGNQLRITTQLIQARSDTHLWSETYDRTLDDIFAIQDEIAASVVQQLRVTLLGEEIPKVTTTDPEAYALFLQSRHVANRFTNEAYGQAESLLKTALEIDPGFAPAWRNLGGVYRSQSDFGRSEDESRQLAKAAYQQALTIDSSYAPAYASLGLLARADLDFTAADQYFQRALQLNPGVADPYSAGASLMRTFGRFDESIDLARKSIVLDPVNSSAYSNLGYSYYYALRFDEAVTAFRKALSLGPGRLRAHYYIGRVLLAQGALQEALVEIQKEPGDPFQLVGLALIYHALGDSEASDRALAGLIEKHGETAAFQIAEAYAFRGENDAAFEWLQKAHDSRDGGLAVFLGNPMLEGLTSDARYPSFVDKLGLSSHKEEMN
jgi:TolB-like protein/Flp pilus assembly protein TadD